VKEAGYKGKAKDGTEYLIESLTHPQDYLVQGFPPIMPVINKPPIGLNNDEIAAVVSFLQSVQGGKVTVTPNWWRPSQAQRHRRSQARRPLNRW
jgi:hypothetical protein